MYTSEIKKKYKVWIVYATTSGNSELVAEAIADGITEFGFDSELARAEVSSPEKINNFDATILISSTWNVGLLNDNMIEFHNKLSTMQLPDKLIDVVGLGDSKNYDIYNGAADILEESVKRVGAKQVMNTLRIDGEVYSRLEEFKNWGKIYSQKLQKNLQA